jgi:hypothetical protein
VSASKFLGFIIHENGIEIDPKKLESIQKVQPPQSKNDMQKFIGELNYLWRFIFNLSGKISAFTAIPHLKNEADFTWGQNNNSLLMRSKTYLSSLAVMKTPKAGIPFRLYIAAEDSKIGAVLTQVTDDKAHIITYLSQCLINAEIRYSFIEKLCFSLFYACSKLRYYLLSSTSIVTCQADVIKHMWQHPIQSGRNEKWAYAMIEYDLSNEPLKLMKGQVMTDFIVGHSIDQNKDDFFNLVSIHSWKLFFMAPLVEKVRCRNHSSFT